MVRGLLVDRASVVVGLAEPLPWVRVPEPTASDVHAGVVRGLREWGRQDAGVVAWGGFAQAGAGAPYHLIGEDRAGARTCLTALTISTTVHATLDRVDVMPGQALVAGGWAFACGEGLAAWTLLVDGQPVDVVALTQVPRPDVRAAFADGCAPDESAGVQLQTRPGVVSPGAHTATLRVMSASGTLAESAPLTFVVPGAPR